LHVQSWEVKIADVMRLLHLAVLAILLATI